MPTAYLIRDADTGTRLAAAFDAIGAEGKARAQEAAGRHVAIDAVEYRARPAELVIPRQPRAHRRRTERPMRFYDLDGQIICRPCRDNVLTNAWRALYHMWDEPALRPRDFQALGERPWAGNPPGERYIQCDDCNGQWGPDA